MDSTHGMIPGADPRGGGRRHDHRRREQAPIAGTERRARQRRSGADRRGSPRTGDVA